MVDVVAAPARTGGSYVEWGPIFAGALAASAISFVLLTAGAAIGLSLVSAYGHESYPKVAASIAVFWSVAVPILSLLVGGYIAGRMRAARADADRDEVKLRDGMHGLLVWSLSIVAGGLLAFLAAGTALNTGSQVASAMSDRGQVVAPVIDSMFGANAPAQAPAPANTQAEGQAPATPGPAGRVVILDDAARAAIARTLVAASAQDRLTPAQRSTLAQILAERTGVPQAEAERRVDQAYADAKEALETARQTAVLAALVTATALLVGLLAAWFAAQSGGRHRDENTPVRLLLAFSRPGRTFRDVNVE
jgi:hypothetical protein